jgi:uncharacterized protein HemX
MTAEPSVATTLVGADHGSGGAMHLVLLAVVVVVGLMVFGVVRWRSRRAAEEKQSAADDRAGESTRSIERSKQ